MKKITNFDFKSLAQKDIFIFFSISMVSLVIILIYSSSQSSNSPTDAPIKMNTSLDTVIPQGFVLIPIEIINAKAIDDLIQNFGVVNLYAKSKNTNYLNSQYLPVATGIKIIRSPKNPSVFAVLSPENSAYKIVRATGPFTVTIHNPKNNTTSFKKEKKKKRKIIIENI
ncbi:MAG: hypothetical protein HOO06_00155 [Bdellovibrionaceae bacterium]|jgi:hypothetical protein|nr:hypothetical protein [Pseudobdellovibrionaceae bacterium]